MKRPPGPFFKIISAGIILLQAGAILWAGVWIVRFYVSMLLPNGLIASATTLPNPTSTNSMPAEEIEASVTATLGAIPTEEAAISNIVPTPVSSFKMCSPLKGVLIQELPAIVSDDYHPPPPGRDGRHMGVDFAFYTNDEGKQIEGFEVNPILPGRVAAVIFDRPPFGNAVILETRLQDVSSEGADWLKITFEQSLYHLYAHLANAPSVDPDYEVDCGRFLGRVGDTGASGNPHLHLETRYGPPGATFLVMANDITASPAIGVTPEEKSNYFTWATSGTYLHFDPMDLFSSYTAHVSAGQ